MTTHYPLLPPAALLVSPAAHFVGLPAPLRSVLPAVKLVIEAVAVAVATV